MNDSIPSQSLLEQAAQISRLERGRLCVLRAGPNGPYYNHQTWVDGKNVTRYVPAEQVPAVQEAIDGYARFQELVERHVEQKVRATRAELAGGVKKKRRKPRPGSSSPRTRKSSG